MHFALGRPLKHNTEVCVAFFQKSENSNSPATVNNFCSKMGVFTCYSFTCPKVTRHLRQTIYCRFESLRMFLYWNINGTNQSGSYWVCTIEGNICSWGCLDGILAATSCQLTSGRAHPPDRCWCEIGHRSSRAWEHTDFLFSVTAIGFYSC